MDIYQILKDLFALAKSLNNQEFIQKVIDVQQVALEQQQNISQQQATITRLQAEVAELEARLLEVGLVEVFHGLYWKQLQDGALDGPFSPTKWDLDRKLVRLPHTGSGDYGEGYVHKYYCSTESRAYDVPLSFYSEKRVKNANELPKGGSEEQLPESHRRSRTDRFR